MDSFWKRVKFYSIGLFLGLIFIIVFFGKRMSCTQYLPNGRVLAEVKSKPIRTTHKFLTIAKKNTIDSIFIMDSLLTEGKINFDESQPRNKPCGKYVLYYKSSKKYKLLFLKCSKEVILTAITIID